MEKNVSLFPFSHLFDIGMQNRFVWQNSYTQIEYQTFLGVNGQEIFPYLIYWCGSSLNRTIVYAIKRRKRKPLPRMYQVSGLKCEKEIEL